MGNDDVLKIFSRLKQSEEGLDFINYLEELSKKNYEEFKKASNDMNDICKGKAIAIDDLIKLFKICDDKLFSRTKEAPNLF